MKRAREEDRRETRDVVKQKIKGAVSSIAVAALLAGCGGGAGAPAVPHTASPTTMSFVVKVPANSSLAKAIRTRHYTSRDAKGIGFRGASVPFASSFPNAFTSAAGGIQDYTAGSGSYYSFTFNLAPGASYSGTNAVMESCDASAATDGSFSCTFTLPVQPGYYDFQIALWDAAAKSVGTPSVDGSNNSFPSGTPVGIEKLTNKLILTNQSNSIPMTMGGVVDSVQMQIDPNVFITGGGTQTGTLSAITKDAAGDIIIGGDQYVDAGGNTLTLTAQVGGAISTDFSFPGSKTFNTPSDTVTVHYNNGASAGSATFSVSPSSALTGLNTGAGVSASSTGGGSIGIPGNPVVNTAAGTAPSGNAALAQDASGNVWAGTDGSLTISEMLQAGHTFAGGSTATLTAGTGVTAMATAGNGIVCFVGVGTAEIGCFDPTAASPVTIGYTAALSSAPNDIVTGSDGNIWVAEAGGKVAQIGASATPSVSAEYDVSASIAAPTRIASGPSGNLWLIDTAGNNVATFNIATTAAAAVTLSGASLSSPTLIAEGSDNNMWIAEAAVPAAGQTTLVKVVPSTGAAAAYVVAGVTADTLINGPDGNLWMSDSTANQMAAVSPGNGRLLKAFALGTSVGLTAQQILTNTNDGSVYASGLVTTGPTPNLYYFAP